MFRYKLFYGFLHSPITYNRPAIFIKNTTFCIFGYHNCKRKNSAIRKCLHEGFSSEFSSSAVISKTLLLKTHPVSRYSNKIAVISETFILRSHPVSRYSNMIGFKQISLSIILPSNSKGHIIASKQSWINEEKIRSEPPSHQISIT